MTLKIRIQVPKNGGGYEAKVEQTTVPSQILEPGDEMEIYVYQGNEINITEMPAGTKAALSGQAN